MKFKKYFSLIEFLFPLKDRRLILIGMLFLFLPTLTLAADFISLVGIPGVPDNGQDLNKYFNAVYRLSISLAALLAVVRIVLAGAKYMLTDIIPAKGEALEDIKGALLGLLIILGAVLILSTINYDLTHYNIKFDAVEPPPQNPVEDPTVELCNDPNSGGCTYFTCQAVVGNLISYAEIGCVIGTTGGAYFGGTLGGIWGFIGGATVGCVGGALSGWTTGSYTDPLYCKTGCMLAGGYMNSKNLTCSIPNDSEIFTHLELIRHNDEIDRNRENNANIIANQSPKSSDETFIYFNVQPGIELTNENFGEKVTSIDDIYDNNQKYVLCRIHEICEDQDTERIIGRLTVSRILQLEGHDVQATLAEYDHMIANLETQARTACKSGTVYKIQPFDNESRAGSSRVNTTTFYCITP